MERRHPNVINLSEVEATNLGAGSRFSARDKVLGAAAGARGLGCSWYEVPPGKTAFPFHYHTANEEGIFVLEGEGTVRIGGESVPVHAGDYIAFPCGPTHPHQLLNTGTSPLRYLCFSTTRVPEVVGYPDSKKIGVMAAASYEAAMRGDRWVRMLAFEAPSVGYYDGEDAGE